MRLASVVCAVLLAWTQAAAFEIAILYSSRIEPYVALAEAFREAVSRRVPLQGPKSVQPVHFTDFVVGNSAGRGAAERFLGSGKADLVLAVGGAALSVADGFPEVPVVYTLVPDPASRIVLNRRAAGVPMAVPPERWVEVTRRALPAVTAIGIVYSERWSGDFVRRAASLVRLGGLDLQALDASSPHEVYDKLESLRGRIDVLWMLPDLTVLTPQTVQAIFRFSMEERVPVVTFAEKYLRKGALIALTPDYRGMGEQAAELAISRLVGGRVRPENAEGPAEWVRVRVNQDIARKLGTTLDTAWLEHEGY